MSRQGAGWSFALVAGAMVACGGNQNQASTEAMACQPVEGTLPADLDAGSWAGTYQVTLVATRGDSTGKSTTGQMRLMPQEESLKETDGAMMPLIGTMEVDLAAVNAVQMGAQQRLPSRIPPCLIGTTPRGAVPGARGPREHSRPGAAPR